MTGNTTAANTGVHEKRVFLGCFMALIATAFGFIVRASILDSWQTDFNLSNEQLGYLGGAGLYPFAISIILFSLIVDRIGYGISMGVAFTLHIVSAIVTIAAPLAFAAGGSDAGATEAGQRWGFMLLYLGTFLYALGNGTVEAVINPVVATMFSKNKTHWLNILHAGWPGGLVLGGLLAIAVAKLENLQLPGYLWQWQMGIVIFPMLIYGLILLGQKFPVQERVAGGASYMDMLREFGAASSYIVSFFVIAGIIQIMVVFKIDTESLSREVLAYMLPADWIAIMPSGMLPLLLAALLAFVPAILFAIGVRSFGRPMFVFLLLVMMLLATTELGTDTWITAIMKSVLENQTAGSFVLIYTSAIMFVLRFFAGPIVHRISPLGLLAASAAVACAGLLWLSNAGTGAWMIFAAATLYGFGKTFFWPTTLGVVSEQYPKGGALMLNAIAGVGMITVGTIGNPAIGHLMDAIAEERLQETDPAVYAAIMKDESGMFGTHKIIDQEALAKQPEAAQEVVDETVSQSNQRTLAWVAILPAIMFVCYVSLILYFRSKGGYKAQELVGHAAKDEEFTGGVPGPVA